MWRTIKPTILSLVLAMTLSRALSAQQTHEDKSTDTLKSPGVEAPLAPVPSPIIKAKKVFISNAGGDSDISPDHYSGSPDRAYNQLFAALKSWGRYELVTAPEDADLIFELHFTAPSGRVDVFNGKGVSQQRPQFRLVILDLKTHVVLWTFTEYLETRHATHDQSFDQALTRIVEDVRKLASPPVKAADTGEKPSSLHSSHR